MCAQELGVLALQYSGNVAECGPACRQADQEVAIKTKHVPAPEPDIALVC